MNNIPGLKSSLLKWMLSMLNLPFNEQYPWAKEFGIEMDVIYAELTF
jgi:hypothetical protein